MFLRHFVPQPFDDLRAKFNGHRLGRTPLPEALNARAVAKQSHSGPIEGYISKTVRVTLSIND